MSDNDYYEQPCHRDPKGARSAATLRELNMKLRAENERLREALSGLVQSVEETFDTRRGELKHLRRLNAARAALEDKE